MTQQGGSRPGPGRKRGSKNRQPAALAVMPSGLESPVDYMLAILHDEAADPKDRAWAAEKAAPYLHPRPAPAQRTVRVDLPATDTAAGIVAAFGRLIQAVAAGGMAPSEAQSIAALIEGQRKAIETTDILDRMKALEDRYAKQPDDALADDRGENGKAPGPLRGGDDGPGALGGPERA